MPKRINEFLEKPLDMALAIRGEQAARLLALDGNVAEIIAVLRRQAALAGFGPPWWAGVESRPFSETAVRVSSHRHPAVL